MHPLLNIALKTSHVCSSILLREYDRLTTYPQDSQSIIASARKETEEKFLFNIREAYPNHAVIFPHTGQTNEEAPVTWLVDVLNGESNYARRLPHFAICVAIQSKNKIDHALIHDPLLNETFTGTREAHAQCNHFRIQVSAQKKIEESLLAGNQEKKFRALTSHFYQTGCNALMLAYTANGRIDGFIANQLNPIELASGSLLVKNAGGLCSDLNGDHDYLFRGELVAANSKLFKTLLQQLKK